MKQTCKPGLYRHFKGGYYVFLNLVRDSKDYSQSVQYFDLFHPESGYFVRSLEDWNADVSDREDNATGQKKRFEYVSSIPAPVEVPQEGEFSDFSVCEVIDDENGQYLSVVSGGYESAEEAFKHLQRHYSERYAVFRRDFVRVEGI